MLSPITIPIIEGDKCQQVRTLWRNIYVGILNDHLSSAISNKLSKKSGV